MMERDELIYALKTVDFDNYYKQADEIRRENVGDVIHIRAILEYSNYCKRECSYCGLNRLNRHLKRYRLSDEEIYDSVREAVRVGYKTIVLQGGEDNYFNAEHLAEIVKEIKRYNISVTVSGGEFDYDGYKLLRDNGADRYLLKHETCDAQLYAELHPDSALDRRIQCLKNIKMLGFETGSGFMVGLPNQTVESIADDILLLKELECDMAGIGTFIPHPDTLLNNADTGSVELTKRAVALTRICIPHINLPATTSLSVLDKEQSRDIFNCGANVIMRKITPTDKRKLYEIYPTNAKTTNIREERTELETMINSLGRIPL